MDCYVKFSAPLFSSYSFLYNFMIIFLYHILLHPYGPDFNLFCDFMFSNVVLYNQLELWIYIVYPNVYLLVSEIIVLQTLMIRPKDKEINMLIPGHITKKVLPFKSMVFVCVCMYVGGQIGICLYDIHLLYHQEKPLKYFQKMTWVNIAYCTQASRQNLLFVCVNLGVSLTPLHIFHITMSQQ